VHALFDQEWRRRKALSFLVVTARILHLNLSASRDVVDIVVVPDVVTTLRRAVVDTDAVARLLEMAVISTTSRFAVDEVGWVSGVSNALLERLGGSHRRGDRDHGSKSEEDVGELHDSQSSSRLVDCELAGSGGGW